MDGDTRSEQNPSQLRWRILFYDILFLKDVAISFKMIEILIKTSSLDILRRLYAPVDSLSIHGLPNHIVKVPRSVLILNYSDILLAAYFHHIILPCYGSYYAACCFINKNPLIPLQIRILLF